MKLYGHQLDTDEDMPLSLKEATLEADSETLRKLAAFLLFVAERMESKGATFGHEHFEDYDDSVPKKPSFIVVAPCE